MIYVELLGALLTYRIVVDLWDCFGFTCEDICDWLGRVAKSCHERRMQHGLARAQSVK